jgi:ABC-type glycerol-3-phosphate transport system permease component
MADIQQMAPVMSDADREVARTLRREKVSRVVRYVVLLFVGLLMLYPLAWMFSASFKPNHEIFTTLACGLPTRPGTGLSTAGKPAPNTISATIC